MIQKEEYTKEDLDEILSILNGKYFASTGYKANDLRIYISEDYFFEKIPKEEGDDCSAYLSSMALTKNGESIAIELFPFAIKTSSEDRAFHIANEVHKKIEKGRMEGQLWENLIPPSV